MRYARYDNAKTKQRQPNAGSLKIHKVFSELKFTFRAYHRKTNHDKTSANSCLYFMPFQANQKFG